jgi:hypothetical protein
VISCTNGCSVCRVSYCHNAFYVRLRRVRLKEGYSLRLGYPRNRGRNERQDIPLLGCFLDLAHNFHTEKAHYKDGMVKPEYT